jgi:transcriptional/translational regulatory protein YebC/TACO1
VGIEPLDEFERELQQGMLRLPAPPGLKRKIMARKQARDAERTHSRVVFWQRLAASIVVCASVGGTLTWHNIQERRKGEAARQQVMVALRIAGHALDQMNAQLEEHDNGK